MKKSYLFFVAAFFMFLALAANVRATSAPGVPTGPEDALATSDYFGVAYSSQAIQVSTNPVLVSNVPGTIVGFIASSNTSNSDYVTFYDTAVVNVSADAAAYTEICRVYLSSINVALPYNSLGTSYKLPAPIRTRIGIAFRTNVSNINIIRLLYTRFND